MENARPRHNQLPLATEVTPLAVTILIVAAHIALSEVNWFASHAWLPLTVVLVAWGTVVAGPRNGFVSGGALACVALDDLVRRDLWPAAAELALVSVLAPAGMTAGLLIRQETAENARMQRFIRYRIARLRGPAGHWHTVAATAMGAHVTRMEATFIDEALSSELPGRVLDIGCGSGRLEFAIAKRADVVIATEIDDDELRLMEDDPRVTAVDVAPMPGLPIRDESLDWIVATEVPAVTDEEGFPEECARVLKPGGGIVLMLYNGASYKGLVARIQSRRRTANGVRWADLYYRVSVRRHLELWTSAGFTARRKRGFYWAPLGRAFDGPLVPVLAGLERLLGLRRLTGISPWVLVELRKR